MRLTRIQLHNFRTWRDLDISLEPLSVVVGPNDAGKTTLADAVHCLLDPEAAAWPRSRVARLPRQISYIDHPDLRGREYSPWQDEAVVVVGTFEALSEKEGAWRPLSRDGTLRIGVYYAPHEDGRRGPYALLPDGDSAPTPVKEGGAVAHTNLVADPPDWPLGERWYDASARQRWVDGEADKEFVLRPLPSVVRIQGPERGPAVLGAVIGPALDRLVMAEVDALDEAAREAVLKALYGPLEAVGTALGRAVPDYLENTSGVAVWPPLYASGRKVLFQTMKAAITPVRASVSRTRGQHDDRDWDREDPDCYRNIDGSDDADDTAQPEQGAWRDTEPLDALGAGAQRAVSLAALELYATPSIWPEDESLVAIVEEPEVGLQPGAVRRVAAALGKLARARALSVVVVTHAPAIIRAAPPAGLIIVREEFREPRVVRPASVTDVAAELGASAADILLAETFVVVEGPSDVAVLRRWAATLGIDLDALGVELVCAKGWSREQVVSELLRVAMRSLNIWMVADGGLQETDGMRRAAAQLPPSVRVRVLGEREIEAYFSAEAVRRWVLAEGGRPGLTAGFRESAKGGQAKRFLQGLARRAFGRERTYSVEHDGDLIAAAMTADEIPVEIRELLAAIAAGPPSTART